MQEPELTIKTPVSSTLTQNKFPFGDSMLIPEVVVLWLPRLKPIAAAPPIKRMPTTMRIKNFESMQ